jgi:hypothetical protein
MQLVARHLRALTLVVFVATWAVRLAAGGLLWSDDGHSGTPRPASDASTTIAHLLHAHDCWREKAPADMRGQVPGHVVVTTRSGRTVYGGPRLAGKALEQQFGHKRAGLTVWGFCR